jgi:hypothetical protein
MSTHPHRRTWTTAVREVFYDQLRRRFGHHDIWENKASPGNGRQEEFQEFLGNFAAIVGAKSDEAASQQLDFAIMTKAPPPSHIHSWIHNRAAAHNAGFIHLTTD